MRERLTLDPMLRKQLRGVARRLEVSLPTLVDELLRESMRAFPARPPRTEHPLRDAVFYRGPSVLTGAPIIGVITGLDHVSLNRKTGPMLQTWILCADLAPMDAVRRGLDDAICGPCSLRGDHGHDRGCYVPAWLGPNNIYRVFEADRYREVGLRDLATLGDQQQLRLGAYGDPAAIPYEVWARLVERAAGWIGYTHQWRTCDPRFRTLLMASVESHAGMEMAHARGWRTFRIVTPTEAHDPTRECRCPASDEMGHRTTCDRCQLCRGQSRPARSVAIAAHGNDGVMTFYRNRAAVGAPERVA